MKSSKKNKEKWLEKVKYTLELGGKSSKTFLNYKSHIIRFLNYFADDIEINKLSEDQIADYFIKKYIQKERCASTLNVGIASVRFFYSVCFNLKLNKDVSYRIFSFTLLAIRYNKFIARFFTKHAIKSYTL